MVTGPTGYTGPTGPYGYSLSQRTALAATTAVISSGATQTLVISGYTFYSVLAIDTNVACRVAMYTTNAAAVSGTGAVVNVNVDAGSTTVVSPAAWGFNYETVPVPNIPLTITNRGSVSAAVTATIHVIGANV